MYFTINIFVTFQRTFFLLLHVIWSPTLRNLRLPLDIGLLVTLYFKGKKKKAHFIVPRTKDYPKGITQI